MCHPPAIKQLIWILVCWAIYQPKVWEKKKRNLLLILYQFSSVQPLSRVRLFNFVQRRTKNLTLVVCLLLPLKGEIKKCLALAAYFLRLETPGLPACYPLSLSNNDPSPSPRSGFSVASGTQCNLILFTNGIDAGMGREHRPQPISAQRPLQWTSEKGHVTPEGLIRVKFTSGVEWWGERDAPVVNSTWNCCRHFGTNKRSQRTQPTHEEGQNQEHNREMEQES